MCVVVVGFWEIMSNRNRGLSVGFELTSDDLTGFIPQSERWRIRSFPVETTPMEPNIAAFRLFGDGGSGHSILVRLVHGYNMCDCMRIKGYTVDLLTDTRSSAVPSPVGQSADEATQSAEEGQSPRSSLQIWRLTSAGGDVSIWVTTMLWAGGFAATDVDVRSMAFPRIGMPDDPNWMPRGITLRSLRHPIRNIRRVLRAKWNNSRCDILTFLGLKQPAWASEDMLTLVSASEGGSVKPDAEQRIINQTVAAHVFMLGELQKWRRNDTREE